MNFANEKAYCRGLDKFNAFVRLISLEQNRFKNQRDAAKKRTLAFVETERLDLEKANQLSETITVDGSSECKATIVCNIATT